jgi:hypothetical protein
MPWVTGDRSAPRPERPREVLFETAPLPGEGSRGPSGRMIVAARWVPGSRPAASSLGSVLPARWAGKDAVSSIISSCERTPRRRPRPPLRPPRRSRRVERAGQTEAPREAHPRREVKAPRRRSLPPKERGDVVLVQREVRRRHDRIDLFRAHHPALLQLGERRPALLDFFLGDRPLDLVEVDGLDAEALAAALHLTQQRVAPEAPCVARPPSRWPTLRG